MKFFKKKRTRYLKRKTLSEKKKSITEYPQEENDKPTDEQTTPETTDTEGQQQPSHIPPIDNTIDIKSILDASQIKRYLTIALNQNIWRS